jgi:ligand-binding sensor domain-containing protein/serine phosphatase RsbU (regulator of sigma subunit)
MACFVVIILLLFSQIPLVGQSYYFDNYNSQDGLSQSKVFTIFQSSKHHIWLGTVSGVSRFDGASFQNYTSENGISSGGVRTIFEDRKGNLWFGHNDGGLSRMNGKKIESLPSNYLFNKDITSILEDNTGKLWITSAGGGAVLILNPNEPLQDLKFERYKGKRLGDMVFNCYKLKDETVYFITNVGIKIYNPVKNSFLNFNPKKIPTYFQITSMYEDSNRNLWFGTFHGGLYKYIPKIDSVTFYDIRDGLSSNWISCISEDINGNMWVGTWGGGITLINDQGMKVYNFQNGLQDNFIRCIVKDVEGNMLIGTNDHGLSIFKGEYFVNFSQDKTLQNQHVWAILEDFDKNIWFGTGNGISIYRPNSLGNEKFQSFNSTNSILPDQIRFLKEDYNHDVWIGSDNQGVFMYDSKKKLFFPSYLINAGLPLEDKGVTAMEIDKKNNIWIGTSDGLTYFNLRTQQVNRLTNAQGLAGNNISSLFVSSDNTIIVGSSGKGLTIIKNDTTLTKINLDGNETPKCFIEDKNNIIWIGTESHGLLGFKNGEIIKRYGLKEGLLSNLINFINIDEDGNLYCGTNKGLNKINLATNKIYIYTKRNGFLGIETKNNATCTDSEGHLWFGTVNGAVCYSPWLDKPLNMQPLTHIYRLRVNQVDRLITSDLRFKSDENSIIFDYISICLTNPDAVQYQVKLEGIDTEWQPVTNLTSIVYPALPPNKYTFKVRARNSTGVWNTVPDYVSFQIMPPIYQRWFFILAMVILGLLIIIVYIKIRERNLITEKTLLEEKVQERTQEVTSMNEELAMKNRDVLDSIQYSKRIQLSVLPSVIPFENTFVLFKPKDIVTGDFFWFMKDDTYEWLAAVDCTGHGVPGAFMSLIGYNSLNKIVKEMGIKAPADILNQLNEEVTKTLNQYQKEESISDGMDISLVRYNTQTHVIDYAGAFNPLWIIRSRELLETRADRFAIGRTPHVNKIFTNDTTQLLPEDTIYLFTDGYADQFGGPENKKYKIAKFKEFIINIQQHSMPKQRQMLEENIERWRGHQIQVDDILVIGRKFRF